MSDEYYILERITTPEEYGKLRAAAGWDKVDARTAGKGLNNSVYSVCAVYKGEVIGCGRLVGDGAMYFYLQDVIVLPEFQGKGIGGRIMEAIMDYLRANARAGAFVGLMAAEGRSGFYERYGFSKRSSEGPGMFMIWR